MVFFFCHVSVDSCKEPSHETWPRADCRTVSVTPGALRKRKKIQLHFAPLRKCQREYRAAVLIVFTRTFRALLGVLDCHMLPLFLPVFLSRKDIWYFDVDQLSSRRSLAAAYQKLKWRGDKRIALKYYMSQRYPGRALWERSFARNQPFFLRTNERSRPFIVNRTGLCESYMSAHSDGFFFFLLFRCLKKTLVVFMMMSPGSDVTAHAPLYVEKPAPRSRMKDSRCSSARRNLQPQPNLFLF